jgi:hypothetical protein
MPGDEHASWCLHDEVDEDGGDDYDDDEDGPDDVPGAAGPA